MIQAFGLTSDSRKDLPSAVDDVSFEAHAGRVTALLGAAGAGKTTTLRLLLGLQQGRGIAYFRGRPLHRIPRPAREVGVLLGDVPGHPSRTVRGHLRMLCAAAGLPARRADEVLEAVGLVSFREERLGTLSRGLDRRLGLACVLLPEPHTLVLDNPAEGVSAREGRWLHGMLRAHAAQGGTVLFSTADAKEAARTADRVLTLERGALVADQEAADFARNRLRPRVVVRSPHAARLAALLAKEARTAHRSVEVVREDGNRLSVYGSTCADVGEAAFRHGILVHQLADEVGDMGPGAGATPPASAHPAGQARATAGTVVPEAAGTSERPADAPHAGHRAAVGVRRLADIHAPDSDSASHHGRALTDPVSAASGAGLPEPTAPPASAPAARATDTKQGAPAEGALIAAGADEASGPPALDGGSAFGGRFQGASVPGLARGGNVSARFEDAAAAEQSERASVTAGTISLAPRPGDSSGTAPADGGPPPSDADGGSGADRTEGRVRPVDRANPDRSAGARPAPPSIATRPDGPPATTRPGDGSAAGRRDAECAPAGRADGPAGAAPDGHRPGTEPSSSRQRSTSRPGGSRTGPAVAPHAAKARPGTWRPASVHPSIPTPRPAEAVALDASSPLPPPISVRLGPGPLRPLRYELRRASGIGTGFAVGAAVLVVSALGALVMGRLGHSPQPRLLAAWPRQLPLPPAALGAGLLGALAFGDEFRHPALAADRGTVPRRLGLLTAKLVVAAVTGLMLAFLTVGCDAEVLYVVYGRELTRIPGDWLTLGAGWFGLVVGCAWAGVLAAGLFRSTTAGLAAVVAVPVVVAPLVQSGMGGASWSADGVPARLRRTFLLQWPFGGDGYLAAAIDVIAQPMGAALALSLAALVCGYLLTALRSRGR
ncbi:ATP-binding cassette domain-containing protein [Streptomyces sp. NPDC015220]|uniref:ATP-binding cassette domain-containing protein n=1 Tax=Streptomyces sp. NPDC015220 TaxID=3364947 RepID=UPI0036F5B53F